MVEQMNNTDTVLSNLQETLLWHQLNDQVVLLKNKGKPTTDKQLEYLKEFCVERGLFSRITRSVLASSLPAVLISDLSTFSFVALKSKEWNNLIQDLMRETLSPIYSLWVLDIDRALAETHVLLWGYNRKLGLIQPEEDRSVWSPPFYELGVRFMEEKEAKCNFADTVFRLHDEKSSCLRRITSKTSHRVYRENDRLVIEYRNCSDSKAANQYYANFCRSAVPPIERLSSCKRPFSQLLSYLSWCSGKPSTAIQNFIEQQKRLLKSEESEARRFMVAAKQRIAGRNQETIEICSLKPFAFIDHPFPSCR